MEQKEISELDKALFLAILFTPCILISQALNSDLWFLLNNGRYVLQHGIPYIEPFTIHNGLSYVMQQWLTSVLFWIVYSKFGTVGLSAVIIVVFACTIWTVYCICMRISNRNFIVSFAVTLFSSIYINIFMVQRPYIFTILFIAIEIYFLERFIAEKKLKFLLPLPILSALLVNLQAALWPMQFIILLPYVIDSFKFKFFIFKGQGYPKKAFFICILIMILAGLINPYGFDGMTYLFRSYGYKEISTYIAEMMPLDINNLLGLYFYCGIFMVILTYIIYKKGNTRLRYALLTIGTAIMAISSFRNFFIFSICGIIPLAFYLRDFKLPKNEKAVVKRAKANTVIRSLLIILIFFLAIIGFNENYMSARKAQQEATLPGAVNYILKNTDTKKIVLYTGYNDGGYAEFMGLRPYIDPRAEVFVKKNNKKYDIMNEFRSLQVGTKYYRNVLNKYNFTHLIVAKTDILYNYLYYDKDYKIVYSNKGYRVYEKK